jgi:hypothetical protein
MSNPGNKDLNYHHGEIARLKEAITASRPNSSRTTAMRAMLKHHEDRIGRPEGIGRSAVANY